jgi:Zn-dependent M28 family amino/carboxypeptidase
MKKIVVSIVFCFAAISSWGQVEVLSFSKDALLNRVKELSSDEYQGREAGTEGGEKARAYVVNQFKMYGINPIKNSYLQPFEFKNSNNQVEAVNVLGVIKGSVNPEAYIVISAHYDHIGVKNGKIYNGADDDASGVSALLTFAEFFKQHPPKHSVVLAAFDAEEKGLQGAKYFVESGIVPLKNIALNINLDMISRNSKKEIYAVGTRYNSTLKSVIENFKHNLDLTLLTGHDGEDGKQDWTYSSDHAPFHMKKIPFLYFGVEDHEDYHKPTDDYENIHPDFYTNVVQMLLLVFQDIDNALIKQ